jgi:glutamine amidotransferase
MCRLFGMTAGERAVSATFWLLEAPDSLSEQSHRMPDGTGLGWFEPDGKARVDKRPIAAFEDRRFACEARERHSRTFVAHVRYASTGGLEVRNTHPFEQAGRLFAHNGVLEGLDRLEQRLGPYRELVRGDTDSERFFALITKETEAAGGDVSEGITAAVRWIADELPVLSLNLILVTDGRLWALRYPDANELWVLERSPTGDALDHSSSSRRIRVHSPEMADAPAVVVASERMDNDPDWRLLEPGRLFHVGADLTCDSTQIVDGPPRNRMSQH